MVWREEGTWRARLAIIDALCPVEVNFAVSAGYGGGYSIGYLILTAIAVSADKTERQTIEVNILGEVVLRWLQRARIYRVA
jgi:hypothetical protein